MTTESLATSDAIESMTDEFLASTSSHQEMIEMVISTLQQNDTAMVQHTDKGYLWKFQYGSVEVFLLVSPILFQCKKSKQIYRVSQ